MLLKNLEKFGRIAESFWNYLESKKIRQVLMSKIAK